MTRRATLREARHGSVARPIAVLLLLAAVPGRALAQPAPAPIPAYAVAVASDPTAQADTAPLQQAGLQALASTQPFVITSYAGSGSGPAAPPPVAGPDQALIQQAAEVNRILETGQQAMSNLELDTAAASFTQVVSAFETAPALVLQTGTQPFAQALVNLGVNAYLSGDENATEDYFRYAVSVDPTVMPDADLFPDVVTVYNKIVDEVASRNLVQVDVSVDPAGAEVWIDGVQKGDSPLSESMAPGKHIFVARAAGYAASGRIVDVRAGRRPTAVAITLTPAAGGPPVAGPPQPQGLADLPAALMEGSGREIALYRSIADQTGARVLLVLWIMPGGGPMAMISIQVFDRQADRVIGAGLASDIPLDPASIGPAAMDSIRGVLAGPAQQLGAVLAPPPPPPPPPWGENPPPPPPGGEETSIVDAWWFWTIIGAVVAGGAATGIYFGVTAGSHASGPDGSQVILEF